MTFFSTSGAPGSSYDFRLSQKTDGNIHNTIMASGSLSEANVALREHPFLSPLLLQWCGVACQAAPMDKVLSLTQQMGSSWPTVGPEKEESDFVMNIHLLYENSSCRGGRPVGQFPHGKPASPKLPRQ